LVKLIEVTVGIKGHSVDTRLALGIPHPIHNATIVIGFILSHLNILITFQTE
jgi:hypothetical protein